MLWFRLENVGLCICIQQYRQMMSWPGEYPDPNTLRQLLQLLQGLVPPVSVSAHFSPVTPQPSCTPADMDVTLQSLLARAAVHITLATVLFRSLMGTAQPVFQPAPLLQPASAGVGSCSQQ